MPPKTQVTTTVFMLCLLGYLVLPGQSSPNIFYNLSMDDGLSRNEVTDIIQDRHGFIWIATRYGLNRYDGYTFVPFHHNPEDPESLSSNNVSVIYEDQSGRLWVGTSNSGLNLYDREHNRFIRYFTSLTGLNDITESEEGLLWIGTASEGLILFDPENPDNNIQYSPNPSQPDRYIKEMDINALLRTHQNEVWVGGASNGVSILNPKEGSSLFEEQFEHIIASQENQSLFINKLFQSSDQKIWISTASGLFCWDPNEPIQTRKIRSFYPFQKHNGPLPEVDVSFLNYIMDITEAPDGNLWLSTPIGLIFMEQEREKYDFFFPNSSSQHSVSGTGCRALFLDDTQTLWIGSDSGISLLHHRALNFDQGIEQKISPPGISADEIWQVIPIEQEYYLTSTSGLFRVTQTTQGPQFQNIKDTNSTALLFDQKDRLYVGTVGSASFYALDLNDFSLTTYEKSYNKKDSTKLLGNSIIDFEKDHTGKIWMAAMGGLNRFDPASGVFKYYERIPFNEQTVYASATNDLLIDRHNHLWVITTFGLAVLPAEEIQKPFGSPLTFIPLRTEGVSENSFRTNALQMAYESRDGTIWIGTNVGLHSASFDGDSIHIQRHYLRRGEEYGDPILPRQKKHGNGLRSRINEHGL